MYHQPITDDGLWLSTSTAISRSSDIPASHVVVITSNLHTYTHTYISCVIYTPLGNLALICSKLSVAPLTPGICCSDDLSLPSHHSSSAQATRSKGSCDLQPHPLLYLPCPLTIPPHTCNYQPHPLTTCSPTHLLPILLDSVQDLLHLCEEEFLVLV